MPTSDDERPIYFVTRHLTGSREGNAYVVRYRDRVMGRVVPSETYLGRWAIQFSYEDNLDDLKPSGTMRLRDALAELVGSSLHLLNRELERRGEVVPFVHQGGAAD